MTPIRDPLVQRRNSPTQLSSAARSEWMNPPGWLRLYHGDPYTYQDVVRGGTIAISASEARRQLYPLIDQVNDDHEPVEIFKADGTSAVLVSKEDFGSWRETAYLFRSPANARRLLEAADRADRGQYEERELIQP
jgi:antitoxin YefM